MTVSFSERLRYGAYAILAILAAGAYLLLGAEQRQSAPDSKRSFFQGEYLPQLRAFENAAQRDPQRDLFANSRPIEAGSQVISPPPAVEPGRTLTSAPHLLSDVKVDGVVKGDSVKVLVRLGPAPLPITVGLGEPFGQDKALSVQSVEGRRVTLLDKTSHTSRVFTLSEE